ncbi:MAG: hypothetical protein IBX40_03345 [Methanosarcinales archaeon]|nr:hypothetical protein [Methanosarcinales archaeon]
MATLHTQQPNTTSPTHTRRISTSTQLPLQEGAGITFIIGTLFHIPDSPDPGHTNMQGWLLPCCPIGLVAGIAIHGHTPDRQINRKAPASSPQERVKQIGTGTRAE